jgi:hypothetical protein
VIEAIGDNYLDANLSLGCFGVAITVGGQ